MFTSTDGFEWHQAKADDFDDLFLVYKTGLYKCIDSVYGWDEQYQKQRVDNHYELNWFHWVIVDTNRVALLCFKLNDNAYHIHLMIVLSGHQRLGIGTRVMEALHQRARDEALEKITLSCFAENIEALAFYKQLGYEVVHAEKEFYSLEYRL